MGAPFLECPPATRIGIVKNVYSGRMPLNGLRHPPEQDMAGWYVWAGEGEVSNNPDDFDSLHVEHLSEVCPRVIPYLGLAPGWRFLVGEGYEDVWEDPALLEVGS